MEALPAKYPVRVEVDYPERLNRLTTAFRIVLAIPILMIFALVAAGFASSDGETGSRAAAAGIAVATALMILFRQRYPRWWFEFQRELTRFGWRVSAYLALLTDLYPSTEDEQAVHLDIDYPDVRRDLNRFLPLIKWVLTLPHLICLAFLLPIAFAATVIAWFCILVTGRYPRPLFDLVLGVGRWSLRVAGYAILLVTDRYPPFSLR